MRGESTPGRTSVSGGWGVARAAGAAAALAAALALPASAQGDFDLAVSQVASADVVNPGDPVTYTLTVTNEGTDPADDYADHADFSLHPWRPGEAGDYPPNPYLSVTPSQGQCLLPQHYGLEIGFAQCDVGPLSVGQSAQIVAVVQGNESMDHGGAFFSHNCFGTKGNCGYTDWDDSDNRYSTRTTVSVPPVLSGSNKVKIKGLPEGCAAGDFTVSVKAKGKDVKQVKAELVSEKQNEDVHEKLGKKKGNKLTAAVPVSQLDLIKAFFYEIKVAAKPGGKAVATFQRC